MTVPSAPTCGLAFVVATAAVCLVGCGGGGGTPTPAPPTPAPTPKNGCTPEQGAKHCTKCDPHTVTCLTCSDGYDIENETKTCIAQCLLPGPGGAPWIRPAQPPPGVYHGISWPMDCHKETEAHFFGIGDWGGDTTDSKAHHTVDNTWNYNVEPPVKKRDLCPPMDSDAQSSVAKIMNDRATKVASPKFVLSAGDHFYWGGIPQPCGDAARNHPAAACNDPTFQNAFENVYEFKEAPWFGVFGNHDFGGIKYTQGWDHQIYRSYCPNSRWRMPGFYWHQKVQFKDFAVDVFMLDGNLVDAANGKDHGICQGNVDCNVPNTSFTDNQACKHFFQKMFDDGFDWLDKKLSESTAEWTIAVNHYPVTYHSDKWIPLVAKHGLDLVFTGHTHSQELHSNDHIMGPDFTTWIISGGGGGITSEGPPLKDGKDDQYGFVDFTISREKMTIEMITHGGAQHTEFVTRKKLTIPPRPKKNLPHMRVDSPVEGPFEETELVV